MMTSAMPRTYAAAAVAALVLALAPVASVTAAAAAPTASSNAAAPRASTAADRPTLANTRRPEVEGRARQGRSLRAFPGRWSPSRTKTRYRWLRDGEPIRGARERRYRLTASDVGTRISVAVRVRAPGHAWTTAVSRRTSKVAYAVPVRRRVTYSVATRGRITTSLRVFRRQAQETFDDARGWRAGGVQFRPVRRGGGFTLVLAEAKAVLDDCVFVSAHTGEGIAELQARIELFLNSLDAHVEMLIPFTDGDVVARLHDQATVLGEEYGEEGTTMDVRLPRQLAAELARYVVHTH